MKGDKVIVRTHQNRALVRRVWEVTDGAVYICSEENFQALSNGQDGLQPVGFPKEYVYKYNPKVNLDSKVAWDSLNAYT